MIPILFNYIYPMTELSLNNEIENVSSKISVTGKVSIIENDHFFDIDKKVEKRVLAKNKILIVKGKLKANKGLNYLDKEDLVNEEKNIIFTDKHGFFKINLPPGLYTFLIFKDDIFYCNSFDGKGFFKSYEINKFTSEINLTFDRNILY